METASNVKFATVTEPSVKVLVSQPLHNKLLFVMCEKGGYSESRGSHS